MTAKHTEVEQRSLQSRSPLRRTAKAVIIEPERGRSNRQIFRISPSLGKFLVNRIVSVKAAAGKTEVHQIIILGHHFRIPLAEHLHVYVPLFVKTIERGIWSHDEIIVFGEVEDDILIGQKRVDRFSLIRQEIGLALAVNA